MSASGLLLILLCSWSPSPVMILWLFLFSYGYLWVTHSPKWDGTEVLCNKEQRDFCLSVWSLPRSNNVKQISACNYFNSVPQANFGDGDEIRILKWKCGYFSKLWTFLICRSNGSHRIIKAARALWRSASVSPLLRAGSARSGCQGLGPDGFCISARMDAP